GISMLSEGSQWRRWDLHVHTPETALSNRFKDWNEYLSRIEASPEVVVIGVTDYMTTSNYSRLKQFQEAGRIPHVRLVPNIEFRLAPPSEKATAVNLHILVSPEDSQHEEKISNALARLDWHYNET